ncbi:dTMP kinase [Sulfurospirillum sp.]|uniref:dTMP kinase n=1 Tax=Sulfurospirillum sp. TaxID=2053622 RepID=UPI002FDEBD90
MKKGKIIVFEGIDGSGKGTQATLLHEYYKKNNIPNLLLQFPCYSETFFGQEVGNYLNGKFGSLDNVHPKFSALLYAGDRFEKSKLIYDELNKGTMVICDRYVPSNIAHQIAKLKTQEEQKELQHWIEKLEYGVFNLPKPDVVFLLDISPSLSSELVLKKNKRDYTDKAKDLHEEDDSYLRQVYYAYKDLCLVNGWNKINCTHDNKIFSIQEIHLTILKVLENGVIND